MRTTLLLWLVSISFGVVALSLAVVHTVLQKQIRRDIAADLQRSILTFRNIETQRHDVLRREVSLLSALPVLKSLMTTKDQSTIQDGAAEFFAMSGADLFALADPNGRAVTIFDPHGPWRTEQLTLSITPGTFKFTDPHYVVVREKLYEVSSQPLYFGPSDSGTRLGYVLLGFSVDHRLAEEIGQVASATVIFYSDQRMVASTLRPGLMSEGGKATDALLESGDAGSDVWIGREHFVRALANLPGPSEVPTQIVVLKSYDQASQYLTQLNGELLALGALLLIVSGGLALYISTSITRPLDKLVAGARALGGGNFEYQLQRTGAREIRELEEAFDRMRHRLRVAREELLAAERLATIGRMASSISHDLRHYLSAVYANAEFLGYDTINAAERLELLSEVRLGVRGMTEMIESLLLFSRTGESLHLSYESLSLLLDRAVTMVKAHPGAQNVRFTIAPTEPVEVWVDARKIERSLYNLLLNGCQAARQSSTSPEIKVSVTEDAERITFSIVDNGAGVPEAIRVSMFEPFVSSGKASGVGLGLTLSHKIAQEHGGSVTLEESRMGYTMFRFYLSKATLRDLAETVRTPEAPATLG
jgi:signal transduction histidine kinase